MHTVTPCECSNDLFYPAISCMCVRIPPVVQMNAYLETDVVKRRAKWCDARMNVEFRYAYHLIRCIQVHSNVFKWIVCRSIMLNLCSAQSAESKGCFHCLTFDRAVPFCGNFTWNRKDIRQCQYQSTPFVIN